jgi:hypothetical protein
MTKEPFGPFREIPSDQIRFAGWPCPRCRKPVRKFGQVIPMLVPRMMFYGCRCVTVSVWEDEFQCGPKTWPRNVALAKRTGAGLLIFNGGRDTPPGFSGIN